MSFELFGEVSALFLGLFIVGTLCCLPLYHWEFNRFFKSQLWVKIVWWIPIFIIFMCTLTVGAVLALAVTLVLLLFAVRELQHNHALKNTAALLYFVVFCIALIHLPLFFYVPPRHDFIPGLIAICFGSVLSDVFAFFGGSYFGKHHLPNFINNQKSWEGVAGQIIGALIGVSLFSTLPSIGFSLKLALGIGLASAVGDLCNSVVKRQLNIKDWGNTIPGHGGVLDRCASLSFALAIGYWLL